MTKFIDVAHFATLFVLLPATSKMRLGPNFNLLLKRVIDY